MGANNNGRHVLLKLAEYITKMAYGKWGGCLDREEILSEAYVAAVSTAKQCPDEITPTTWTSKLGWEAYSALITGLKKQRNIPRSKNDRLQLTNSEIVCQAKDEALGSVEADDEITWMRSNIPSDAYKAILLNKGSGHPIGVVAEIMGESKYRIRKLISTATRIIRRRKK